MKTALKILLGLILVVIPLWLIFPGMTLESWGMATLNLLKGGVTIGIILAGIVLIIMGISSLKD